MTETSSTTINADHAAAPSGIHPRRWRGPDVVALVLLLAIGASVHFFAAQATLSFDELWNLGLAAGRERPMGYFEANVYHEAAMRLTTMTDARPLWRVWTGLDGVLHPPLFLVLLRFWRQAFGDGDLAAQAFSSFCMLVALAAMFAATRVTLGRGLAFLTVLAMAASPTQAYFAQEVRPYALVIALGAIALWLASRVELDGPSRSRAIVLGLMPLPILLTHYFGFGAVLGLAVYGMIRLHGHRRAFAGALVAGAVIYCAAWLPWAVQQLDDLGTGDEFMRVARVDLVEEVALVACAPFRLIVDRFYEDEPAWLAGGVLFVLPWLLLRRSPWLLPWALWLSGSILTLVVLDLVRSTSHVSLARYLAIASPAVLPLMIGCIRSIDRRIAYVAAAGMTFMGAIFLHGKAPVNADCPTFGPVANEMLRLAEPDEALIVYHGQLPVFYNDAFLITCAHPPGLFPRPMIKLTAPLTPELSARLPTRRAWFMTGPLATPIDEVLPGARVLSQHLLDRRALLFYVELPDATPATSPAPPLPPPLPPSIDP